MKAGIAAEFPPNRVPENCVVLKLPDGVAMIRPFVACETNVITRTHVSILSKGWTRRQTFARNAYAGVVPMNEVGRRCVLPCITDIVDCLGNIGWSVSVIGH